MHYDNFNCIVKEYLTKFKKTKSKYVTLNTPKGSRTPAACYHKVEGKHDNRFTIGV